MDWYYANITDIAGKNYREWIRMDIIVYILLTIAIAFFVKVYSHRKNVRKMREALCKQFGKKPKARKYDFENLGYHWNEYKKILPEAEMIDEITWNDLEMDKLFSRVNNCSSFIGEQVCTLRFTAFLQIRHTPSLLKKEFNFSLKRMGKGLICNYYYRLGKDSSGYFLPRLCLT